MGLSGLKPRPLNLASVFFPPTGATTRSLFSFDIFWQKEERKKSFIKTGLMVIQGLVPGLVWEGQMRADPKLGKGVSRGREFPAFLV